MTPFTLHVPDEAPADLRERLARTRFADQPPGAPWASGTDGTWLQDLVAYWRDGFLRPPRSLAERTFRNLQRWTVMEKGGHFAALEQPEALARDIVAFARPLRA